MIEEKFIQKQQSLIRTINISNTAGLENVNVIQAWNKTTAVCNKPMNVSDNRVSRTNFQERARTGGAIPKSRGFNAITQKSPRIHFEKMNDNHKKDVIFYFEQTCDFLTSNFDFSRSGARKFTRLQFNKS